MKLDVSKLVFVFLFFLLMSGRSNACSELLNTLMYKQIKPLLEKSQLCNGLKREVDLVFGKTTIGIDKTDAVSLTQFKYCFDDKTSRLRANVFVRCKTSDKAVIKTHLQEDIWIEAKIDNDRCKIIEFHASPRGDLGKLVARNSGFLSKTRKSMQDNLHLLCGS